MFDISEKYSTLRTASAVAQIKTSNKVIELIKDNMIEKGNVFETARIAAILSAKRTWELIPHCHPIPVDNISVEFSTSSDTITINVTVKTVWKTGVEMESLLGVSIAALTIYDMVKPLNEPCEIAGIKLLEKTGGKSDFIERFDKPLKACILVASDATSAGKREDKSGRILKDELLKYGMDIVEYIVLPDEKEQIKKYLSEWVSRKIDIVFTTGGTGLGPRDVTVEATKEIIEREIPGISEAMRAFGQQRTPYSMLSRGISGVAGTTVIINLPGSSRGVKESLDAILPGVFHIFPMLKGGGHRNG
jgi:cyclic pyranopterin phosphate synthase